nr:hypothetical protein [uncultured Undibacterium sp.]
MVNKTCLSCGELFLFRPQNPTQTYCAKKTCQLKRRNLWQKQKLQTDPDYRENQTRAQQEWMKRNANYWQKYRASHHKYVEHNRVMQRIRNSKISGSTGEIAKMDASTGSHYPAKGIYLLTPQSRKKIAKMDVWTVELTLISVQAV